MDQDVREAIGFSRFDLDVMDPDIGSNKESGDASNDLAQTSHRAEVDWVLRPNDQTSETSSADDCTPRDLRHIFRTVQERVSGLGTAILRRLYGSIRIRVQLGSRSR